MDVSAGDDRPSWVMGRSARWHTAEGRAMLAEQAVVENDYTARLRLVVAPLALLNGMAPVDAVSVVLRLAHELRRRRPRTP